jgi:DNA-binding transcriptional LysR family regulator
MDTRQIQIFVAVLESGSMTAAARSLGVTQPAVSAALAQLERHVGFRLFEREGRQIVPTSEALLLHQEAMHALAGLSRLDEAAAGIQAATRGHLTIATNPGPGIAWLPQILAEFRSTRPGVTVRFLTRSSREVRDLVATRAFDLGIAEAPFDRTDAVVHRYRFDCVAVLRADHPLATEGQLTPALLDDQPLVCLLPGHGTTMPIARAFEAAGAHANVVAECEFYATALNLVLHGAGICLSDPISAAQAAQGRPDLVVRPFLPIIPYEVGVLRPSRGGTSRLAEQFIEALNRFVLPHLGAR